MSEQDHLVDVKPAVDVENTAVKEDDDDEEIDEDEDIDEELAPQLSVEHQKAVEVEAAFDHEVGATFSVLVLFSFTLIGGGHCVLFLESFSCSCFPVSFCYSCIVQLQASERAKINFTRGEQQAALKDLNKETTDADGNDLSSEKRLQLRLEFLAQQAQLFAGGGAWSLCHAIVTVLHV